LCQFAAESVDSLSKYHVHKFVKTNGKVDNIIPRHANLAWWMH